MRRLRGEESRPEKGSERERKRAVTGLQTPSEHMICDIAAFFVASLIHLVCELLKRLD